MNATRREQVIMICIPMVLLALFYLLMVQPGTSKLEQIHHRNRELARQSEELNNIFMHLAKSFKEIGELDRRLADAVLQVPPTDQVAQFEDILVDLGNKYALINSDRPAGADYLERPLPTRDGTIITQPVTIRFTGTPRTFYDFLSDVEQLKRLTEVTLIDMRQTHDPEMFYVTLELSIFFGKL